MAAPDAAVASPPAVIEPHMDSEKHSEAANGAPAETREAAITAATPTATNNVSSGTHSDPDNATGVRKTPFIHPAKSSEIPEPVQLTTEQQTAYNSVLNTVAAWTHVPVSTHKDAESVSITEDEQQWLTRECLLRYLRATKWDMVEATNRLIATLAWRREYGLQGGKLTPEYISIENETGKQWLMGYDSAGRPCHYLNPSRQNTERSDRQIEHLVYMMERDIDIMPAGQETLALLINFAETSKGQGATVSQGRQVLSILQAHYPERLGRALLIHLPWFFWAFMKLITPFIDPLTRQKLIYNDDLRKHVPPEQLLKSHGGDVDFEYEHDKYWPALNKLAEERRTLMKERWVRGGKRVGEFENYLKGGQEEGLTATIAKDEEANRVKRPVAQRSGTSRSGCLKVERADGDEQRTRKSVSIYDGREGHDDAPKSSPSSPPKSPPTSAVVAATVVAAATESGKGEDTANKVSGDSIKATAAVDKEGKKDETTTVLAEDTQNLDLEGVTSASAMVAKEGRPAASPVQVSFGDGQGNPLPLTEGHGKRQTSPGRIPRRMSNPKPPDLTSQGSAH